MGGQRLPSLKTYHVIQELGKKSFITLEEDCPVPS